MGRHCVCGLQKVTIKNHPFFVSRFVEFVRLQSTKQGTLEKTATLGGMLVISSVTCDNTVLYRADSAANFQTLPIVSSFMSMARFQEKFTDRY